MKILFLLIGVFSFNMQQCMLNEIFPEEEKSNYRQKGTIFMPLLEETQPKKERNCCFPVLKCLAQICYYQQHNVPTPFALKN